MIHLNPCSLPEELLPGLQALAPVYGFQLGSEGVLLSAVPGDKIRVDLSEGKATVAFRRRIHFFRGLGLLLEALSRGETAFSACDVRRFPRQRRPAGGNSQKASLPDGGGGAEPTDALLRGQLHRAGGTLFWLYAGQVHRSGIAGM